MALSGSFHTYPTGEFGLYCEWSGQQVPSGNYTNITLKMYLRFYDLEVGSRSDSTISINGVSETFTAPSFYDYDTNYWHNVLLKTKTVKVAHNSDGTKNNVKLSASWRFDGVYSGMSIGTITASTTVNLDPIAVYQLTTTAGSGSKIIVNRTSSGYGSVGDIESGAKLYSGDKLKIIFTPDDNYSITTHTVNNVDFASGNTHTVSGNVNVVSEATPLGARISATDATIGGKSFIAVERNNTSHWYVLSYKFGNLSGYISSLGQTNLWAIRLQKSSLYFSIPDTFYDEIPNDNTGICTITCTTYDKMSGGNQVGEPVSCDIVISVSSNNASPLLDASVIDTNEKTIVLTGDSSCLINHKSHALCTLTATPQNSAKISELRIENNLITGTQQGNSVVATKTYPSASKTSFNFYAADSRGNSSSKTIRPIIIDYIQLTCNPILTRPTPTGGAIVMSVTGNYYRGSFGKYNNTLRLRYRFKKDSDDTYSSWVYAKSSKIIIDNKKYYSDGSIDLREGLEKDFDYNSNYLFEIQAIDGGYDESTQTYYNLSVVTKTITVKRGIPICDWGENDFNFNVPIHFENVNIFDIIYPIGTIYINKTDGLPDAISKVGSWTMIDSVISGTYAWERTG